MNSIGYMNPYLVLGVELDLEDLGAVHLAPCALADNLRGEHEVLKKQFTKKKTGQEVASDMAAICVCRLQHYQGEETTHILASALLAQR